MEENERFISCKCKLQLSIYAFLIPLLFICIRYFHDELFEICNPKKSFKILKYNLPYLFYLYLPKIFSIICILIVKSNSNGENNSSERISLSIKNYHINVVKEKRKKVFILFFIISLLEVLQDDGDSLIYYYQIAITK